MGIRNYLIEGISGSGKTSVAEALERCPDIALQIARPARYLKVHKQFLDAIATCIPHGTPASVDEVPCWLLGRERRSDRGDLDLPAGDVRHRVDRQPGQLEQPQAGDEGDGDDDEPAEPDRRRDDGVEHARRSLVTVLGLALGEFGFEEKGVGAGDTLIVVRLDRLARSVSHLLDVIEDLTATARISAHCAIRSTRRRRRACSRSRYSALWRSSSAR